MSEDEKRGVWGLCANIIQSCQCPSKTTGKEYAYFIIYLSFSRHIDFLDGIAYYTWAQRPQAMAQYCAELQAAVTLGLFVHLNLRNYWRHAR